MSVTVFLLKNKKQQQMALRQFIQHHHQQAATVFATKTSNSNQPGVTRHRFGSLDLAVTRNRSQSPVSGSQLRYRSDSLTSLGEEIENKQFWDSRLNNNNNKRIMFTSRQFSSPSTDETYPHASDYYSEGHNWRGKPNRSSSAHDNANGGSSKCRKSCHPKGRVAAGAALGAVLLGASATNGDSNSQDDGTTG